MSLIEMCHVKTYVGYVMGGRWREAGATPHKRHDNLS